MLSFNFRIRVRVNEMLGIFPHSPGVHVSSVCAVWGFREAEVKTLVAT